MTDNSRAAQSARTRTSLEHAAVVVFARKGYLNTKVTDITAEAGRAAGSFYNHFADKDELLLSLCAGIGTAADAVVETQAADARESPTFRAHLEVYWTVFTQHRIVLDALTQAALVNTDLAAAIETLTKAMMQPWTDRLDGFAQQGVELAAPAELMAQMIASSARTFMAGWTGSDAAGIDVLTNFVDTSIFGTPHRGS